MPFRQPRVRGRVLYVLACLQFGGAEVQVLDLAVAMRARGWDPLVLGLMPPNGLEVRAAELGLAHADLGIPQGSWSPRLARRLVRVCRAFQPAVLHTHTFPPNLAGRLCRPLLGVPVLITSAHSVNEGGPVKMAMYRATDRLADLTTNVSRAAVDRYLEIGAVPSPARIRQMTNGVDLSRFSLPSPESAVTSAAVRASLGVAPGTFLWVAVGSHSDPKDYPNLVAAVGKLPADGQHKVVIVGRGEGVEATIALLIERGLSDRVIIAGGRSDVPDILRAADGYVMSSHFEGLPVVLLEAAACGLPIVATDVGGNAQIVVPGETGWLVPRRDPDALAGAMAACMALPTASREAMGRRGRAHVAESFEIGATADRWDALYRELLACKGASGWAPTA